MVSHEKVWNLIMIKVDLVTGFLGSGKTTFIKEYAHYLMEKGEKICILENDFGAVNVDMLLLHELLGEQCDLEMVAGGCDSDCHKRRFKTKMISMGMRGFDRVIIEPSGIYDIDEFFDTLREEPLDNWYEIGNVITVVDSNISKELTKQSRYLLASQIASCGTIVFSKTEEINETQLNQILNYLNDCLMEIKSSRIVGQKDCLWGYSKWDGDTWNKLDKCGFHTSDFVKMPIAQDDFFQSLCFMETKVSVDALKIIATELIRDKRFGHVIRVKGFVPVKDDRFVQFNITSKEQEIKEVHTGQDVFIIIGEELNEGAIHERLKRDC